MKNYLYFLKITAALLFCAILAAGCSEEEPQAYKHPERLVRNLYFPARIDVYHGQRLGIQGAGFLQGDLLSFRSATKQVDLEVEEITEKTARVVISPTLERGQYDIFVVRGSQQQYAAAVKVNLTTDQEVPDKEGATIKGIVYCGNKGIANVRVSDGIQTTTTDANGYYWLSSLKSLGYVFITLPSGYEPTIFDNDMMGFWSATTSGADVCETHNFELEQVNNDRFVLLVGADLHLANKQNDLRNFKNGFLAETQAYAAASTVPVYCLMMGDMTWDKYWYDNKFRPTNYKTMLTESGYTVPIFHAIGNHDNDPYVKGDGPGQLQYCNTLGPNYYSLNLGKAHYVVLDDIDWINTNGSQGVVGNRDYNRLVSVAQMDWLKEDLNAIEDKTAPLFVCLHVQLYENYNASFTNQPKMSNATGGTAALMEAVAAFSDVHFISGHTHYNATMKISNTVIEHNTAAVCETWWWSQYLSNRAICVDGSPAGYGIYTVDAKQVAWSYKGIGEKAETQFRAYDMNTVKNYLSNNVYQSYLAKYPSRNNQGDDYAGVEANAVFINVWNYDPQWQITVTEGGRELPVKRIFQRDPLHTLVFDIPRVEKGYEATTDWASCPSSHMFCVTASGPGSTLDITVTDRFGNVYKEQMTRPKAYTATMK